MARCRRTLTLKKKNDDRIPDFLGEGVAIVLDLWRSGMLSQVADRIHIRREGGYCGFDIVLFFLFYFLAAKGTGIRKFWEMIRFCQRKLAALAERKRLSSPASVSRALEAVEFNLIRPFTPWLLSVAAGIDKVLGHPAMMTYDALGCGWHVFDFDPTVTTLRQRALPEADDLPEPMRRAEGFAKPGYPGRKRGEVQIHRGTLQHAGSSAWLHATMAPGNGEAHVEYREALFVVVQTAIRLGHPLDHVLLRNDGAFGSVPFFSDCREHGVPFLSRLTRPKLFEQPEILKALKQRPWHYVPDSLSGPRRSAMELGILTIPASKEARRADGSSYDPIEVRVVVSRYPSKDAKKDGVGVELDGWRYEMFAIDASEEAFPAPEVVALYYGRAAQENRFSQEDHEVGLDRIFSYHLPGQELAVAVGLWVWNLCLVHGFELATPPCGRPNQSPCILEVDRRILESESAPTPAATPAPTPAPEPPSSLPKTPAAKELVEELGRIDWENVRVGRIGWSMNRETGCLICPDNRELVLTTVLSISHGRELSGLVFCRPTAGCEACEPHDTCFRTQREGASKHIQVSVPTQNAARLRQLLCAMRGQPCPTPRVICPTESTVSPNSSALPSSERPPECDTAPLKVLSSLFLPARARHLFRDEAATFSFSVYVILPEDKPKKPELLADSVADRQHRRKTWREKLAGNEIDEGTQVHIEVSGGGRLRAMLGEEGLKMSA